MTDSNQTRPTVRWAVTAALLIGIALLSGLGAYRLYEPVPVVNHPVPPDQPQRVQGPAAPVAQPLVAPGAQPLIAPGAQPLIAPGAQPLIAPGAQPLIAPGAQPLVAPGAQPVAPSAAVRLAYVPAGTVGNGPAFERALTGLAYDPRQRLLYAAGDQEVKVFRTSGRLVRRIQMRRPPLSVAVDAEGNVYVGQTGRIEQYGPDGNRLARIADGAVGEVTAVAVRGRELLAGDAAARLIRRYDISDGFKHLGNVPRTELDLSPVDPKERVLLPNRTLDFAVAADGRLVVANPGRHLVQIFDRAGRQVAAWGRFDRSDPRHFAGCCNPINVAALPLSSLGVEGLSGLGIVTAEKALARVKLYDAAGQLLSVIGIEHFDQQNLQMDLAVDGQGRIYVADTRPRIIRRFDPQKP